MYKLQINNENGEIIDYLYDLDITSKLLLTSESSKIKKNCQAFDLDLEDVRGNVKISTREFGSILMITQDKNIVQFLLKKDLDILEVINISDDLLPPSIKEIFIQTLQIKGTTFGD